MAMDSRMPAQAPVKSAKVRRAVGMSFLNIRMLRQKLTVSEITPPGSFC